MWCNSWQFWAILSALFAALTAVLAKAGVAQVDPNLATWIRTLVVVIVLGALLATRVVPTEFAWNTQAVLLLIVSGLATGASWLCYFKALKLGPASRVAPVDKLSVVLVAVLGVLLLGEKLAAQHWIGLTLIVVGIILIAR
jgi:transporter family protein